MKTQQELQLHYWGPHYYMIKAYNAKHGCDVKPWECVTYEGSLWQGDHPRFNGFHHSYAFALTILYDDKLKKHRPVFVGDRLYVKTHINSTHLVGEFDARFIDFEKDYQWNPPTPKRTFKLEFTEEERKALMCLTSMSQSHVLVDLHNKFTAAARDKE